jgi:hypothetical protein
MDHIPLCMPQDSDISVTAVLYEACGSCWDAENRLFGIENSFTVYFEELLML